MVTDRDASLAEIERRDAEIETLRHDLSVVSLQNMALNREVDELKKDRREATLELIQIMGQLADEVSRQQKDADDLINNIEAYGPIAAALIYTWGTRCSEYQEGCRTCGVWDEFDSLQLHKGEITRLLNLLADERTESMKLRARITELEGQHKGLVLNNAILRERPDLPLNRIPAARVMTKLYEENESLRAALRETLEVASRNEAGDYIGRARAALGESRT